MNEAAAFPPVASREEWLSARKALLKKEKELLRTQDAISAERRSLPMVKVDKDYVFEGPDGKVKLVELFDGRRQLIVYHFMFDPAWEKGCEGCTGFINDLVGLDSLHGKDTTLVAISRAPLPKLEAYKKRMGWTVPWFSSFGSDFNYDFQVTTDDAPAHSEYNYRSRAQHLANGEPWFADGEHHGVSVFLRDRDSVFHSYSTYARGVEPLVPILHYLDLTPLGRQGA